MFRKIKIEILSIIFQPCVEVGIISWILLFDFLYGWYHATSFTTSNTLPRIYSRFSNQNTYLVSMNIILTIMLLEFYLQFRFVLYCFDYFLSSGVWNFSSTLCQSIVLQYLSVCITCSTAWWIDKFSHGRYEPPLQKIFLYHNIKHIL